MGPPSVAGEVLYVVNQSLMRLEARSVADGHLLWQWSPGEGLDDSFKFGSIVAADNLVFVSSAQQVYAIDIEKRSRVWSYPVPGLLSVSASGILYIVRLAEVSGGYLHEGKVVAINLK
ncbi:outer membrane protein assembly factor BamB family protein [Stigmatella ashevillensis]